MASSFGNTPLSPAKLYILLALASGDLHGYGIMQAVARESENRYKLGPGTLYDNLQRLLDLGLIEEVAAREAQDARRRRYRLSSCGAGILKAEIGRLEAVVREARLRLGNLGPGGATT